LKRGAPIAFILVLAVLLTGLVLARVTVRTDIADLLPQGQTETARFMLNELRSGSAANLILIGLQGAPQDALAKLSQTMTARLRQSGLFDIVNNGENASIGSAEQDFLFRNRYLLSEITRPETFTAAALRQDMQRLLEGLQTSAAPLVSQFGLRDPPGALECIAQAWIGSSRIRVLHDVWFAGDRDRALILAQTHAPGMDAGEQDKVAAVIDAAFASGAPPGAKLLVSGPPTFAQQAAHSIHRDVARLSLLSSAGVLLLLWWRFRSGWVIAVIAIPVVLGIGLAALAVQLVFGFVHGVALGFGMTMLGVSIDYPVLLVGHRKQGEPAPDTLHRIGRAFTLAVLAAVLGLTSMLVTGFPGLSQLGLFAVVGLLVAAAVTRWLLPWLIVRADLAPASAGDPVTLLRIERLRAVRPWAAACCVACAGYLVLVGGPHWDSDITSLSPVPRAALALDAEMRAEIGAPEPGQIGLDRGDSAESVLQKQERLLPALARLQETGALEGTELAARLLPSAATQLARRAALPEPEELAARVSAAQQGLPFRANAFQPFIDDVAATRALPPVRIGDITDPLIAARLASLLFQRNGVWYGLIIPAGVKDPASLAAALRGGGAAFIDMAQEADRIVADYTDVALRWLIYGGVGAVAVLLAGLRDITRVARVGGAVLSALLVTVALLTAAGAHLSLIYLVSLQFVAGVGLDYALFFARRQLDEEERARTLRTLLTCNAMTILTFGLLALCRTPLLHQIGLTVVIGAIAALVFGFLFAGPRPRRGEAVA